jgi:hypothetical protein
MRLAMYDMSMDIGHKLEIIVGTASLLNEKDWTYDGNAIARQFMEDVSSFGRFSPELKDDPRFQPSSLEKCLRFVQCQAFLNAFELGACSSSDRDEYELGLHAFGLALSRGTRGSYKRKVLVDCPIAKELKGRQDVVFVTLTGCLQRVVTRPTGRGVDLDTCDADIRGSSDIVEEEEGAAVASPPLQAAAGGATSKTVTIVDCGEIAM